MTESREERFARKLAGGGGHGAAMTRLLAEIEEATEEIRKMRDEGATAKEMAASLKYVSVLTLLENLSGDDRRLANDAAKELLKAGMDAAPVAVVNVLNVDHSDLARRLAFLDNLKSYKSVSTLPPSVLTYDPPEITLDESESGADPGAIIDVEA